MSGFNIPQGGVSERHPGNEDDPAALGKIHLDQHEKAMKMHWLFVCAAISAPIVTVSQQIPTSAAASVEGDLYLVMQSGDTKKGAGQTVYLLRDTDELHARRAAACAEWYAASDPLSQRHAVLQDSADRFQVNGWNGRQGDALVARERAMQAQIDTLSRKKDAAVRNVLAQAFSDSTGTGMNAHFRFTRVPAGKYVLFTEWRIGRNDFRWWVPLSLSPAQDLHKDLDNSGAETTVDSIDIPRDTLTAATLYCYGKN